MPDVTKQLARYFDATVERVTAEDVLAGSGIRDQNGWLKPARPPRLRPAWVVVAGFAATIVLIGGAVGVVRLLEGDSSQTGTVPAPAGDAADGLSGPWVMLIAAGVIVVLAVVGLAWRSRREIVKEQAMQTLERPEVEVSPRPRSPAILILLVALLVLAAGALGWWIGSSSDGADVPEIVELVSQAWVDGDAEAVAALYAEDGIYDEVELDEPLPQGERYVGRIPIMAHVRMGLGYADFHAFEVESIVVLDNLIAYQWTATGMSGPLRRDPFESTGLTVLELEDGLIARSTVYYDATELFNRP